MNRLQRNITLVLEGQCWHCGELLVPINGWAVCEGCDRRFRITGRRVQEQLGIIRELRGKSMAGVNAPILCSDGRVVVPTAEGVVPDDAEWLACEFEIPMPEPPLGHEEQRFAEPG